jgi:hypothetical protein
METESLTATNQHTTYNPNETMRLPIISEVMHSDKAIETNLSHTGKNSEVHSKSCSLTSRSKATEIKTKNSSKHKNAHELEDKITQLQNKAYNKTVKNRKTVVVKNGKRPHLNIMLEHHEGLSPLKDDITIDDKSVFNVSRTKFNMSKTVSNREISNRESQNNSHTGFMVSLPMNGPGNIAAITAGSGNFPNI